LIAGTQDSLQQVSVNKVSDDLDMEIEATGATEESKSSECSALTKICIYLPSFLRHPSSGNKKLRKQEGMG
jgi:hypothetical protein